MNSKELELQFSKKISNSTKLFIKSNKKSNFQSFNLKPFPNSIISKSCYYL